MDDNDLNDLDPKNFSDGDENNKVKEDDKAQISKQGLDENKVKDEA